MDTRSRTPARWRRSRGYSVGHGTGTDDQRRSAIRNSHLLEEVFAALDDFGLTHDAGLFRPDERGRYGIIFEDIRWHGRTGSR